MIFQKQSNWINKMLYIGIIELVAIEIWDSKFIDYV